LGLGSRLMHGLCVFDVVVVHGWVSFFSSSLHAQEKKKRKKLLVVGKLYTSTPVVRAPYTDVRSTDVAYKLANGITVRNCWFTKSSFI
jgi:hypothetical protein